MLQLSLEHDFYTVILKIKPILRVYSLRVSALPQTENFWVLP